MPPPLPPKQLGAGTTITYQSNGMATASMVLGILGVVTSFLFIPGYLFGTLALIFGFLALRQVRKSNGLTGGKNAARAGIACSLVALAISVALTAIIATHQPTASDKTRDRMNAAVNELLRTKTIRAHGNNGEALRLANLYAETITGLDAASFTSTDEGPRPFYTVHCERQGDKCAFVVYVPEYRNFEKDAKQLLEELAWVATRHLPINPDGKSGTPLCVVLRGGVLTGAVMVGKAGTEKPDSTSKDDKFLDPFFAVAPAAPPPPLTPGASDPSQVE
ncbi:MAG: DUF4190 domain-containing protein [Verrucomicrobiaceae bacterium]|nr:MAG: DUF4190 domain-containing protein [Verrucomicrobiaceae bacterium]